MTDYTTTVEQYGRQETRVDLARFVVDLAKELGGKVANDPKVDADDRTHIMLGTERLDFSTRTWGAGRGRVHVSIWAPDIKHDERGYYGDKLRTESATIDPNKRTIQAIAKDIKKRVVEGSKEALRLQREYADTVRQGRADIKKHAARLQQSTGLDVRVNEGERRAAVYSNGDGFYLSATLSEDGTIGIDRIGSMPLERFEALVFVLKGGNQ
jgi:hypothetical protein